MLLTLLRRASASVCLALFFFFCADARAATFTVTNTNGSGAGSLTDAITQANNQDDADTIVFAPGVSGTITLPFAELSIGPSLTIVGPGAQILSVSGGGQYRVFYINRASTTVNISGLTITGGSNNAGAGIYNPLGGTLNISNCIFSGNNASSAGGGVHSTSGAVTVTNCAFSSNTASGFQGGAFYTTGSTAAVTITNCTFTSNTGSQGGAIATGSGATVSVAQSTFTSNGSSTFGGCIYGNGSSVTVSGSTFASNYTGTRGGAIYSANGTVNVSNSTFSGNSGANGAGVYSDSSTLTLSSTTFSANIGGDGSCLYARIGGGITLRNNIFVASDGVSIRKESDVTVTAEEFNLASDSGGGVLTAATDKINTDPKLGPLGNNGGTTQTFALLSDSPAIDAGNSPLLVDQRGYKRPVDVPAIINAAGGNASDMGAFEFDPPQTGSALIVNTVADHDDGVCGTTDCTLREAVRLAPDGGTVTFAANVTGTITLGGSDLYINKSLTVQGPGAKVLSVSGNNLSRVFNLAVPLFGSINLSGLTITHGRVDYGGGIYASGEGTLSVSRCIISSNNAIATGVSTGGDGGGFFNSGNVTLSVDSCTFTNNSGSGSGGGGALSHSAFRPATVSNSTFSGNSAYYGGAVGNFCGNGGSLTLESCTFSGNTGLDGPGGYGGSVYNGFYGLTLSNNIFNDTAGGSIDNSNGGTVTDAGYNLARDGGGGVLTAPSDKLNTNPKLGPLGDNGGPTPTHALLEGSPALNTGNTALTIDQRGVPRPFGSADDMGAFEFTTDPSGSLGLIVTTAEDVTYADGLVSLREAIANANASGGSIGSISFSAAAFAAPRKTITLNGTQLPAITSNSLSITGPVAGVVVSGNNASRVFEIGVAANVFLNGLTIVNGGNNDRGGGILNRGTLTVTESVLSGNRAENGGGIFNDPNASLTVRSSTLSGNGVTSTFGKGGAIHNEGALRVENSTLSSNAAYFAAALYNAGSPNRFVLLESATIASNQANDCGGIINDSATAVALVNTLIANNTNTNGGANRSNIAGDFAGFNNLVSNGDGSGGLTNGVNSNQIGSTASSINALLGSLANNGGFTQTFALLPGSPAIDAGETNLSTDQRGVARPQRNAKDIGAFERQNSAPLAGADSLQRFPNQSVSVPEATLLANDIDPEGDGPLIITSVSATTSGQGTVSRANGYIFYDPAPGYTGGDTFTYQVQDSFGASAVATVTITVNSSGNPPVNATLIALEAASGNVDGTQARVIFTQLPGRTYQIQYTDNLAAPTTWTSLGTMTANAQGQFQIVDVLPSPRPPRRFYRAVYP